MRKSFFRQKRKLVAETSSLKHEIQELMDAPIYYEWLIDVIPSHDATPNECQLAEAKQNEMMKLYGEKAKATIYFRENSKQLKNLIDEYKKNQNVETRAFPESVNFCRLVEEMEENNEFEETEENEKTEIQVESPAKNSRTLYLKFKQPLQAFKRDLNKLDEEARSILIENNEEIFNEDMTYQQQVEMVISLIYDIAGPTRISELFGVTRGTISEHKKRMCNKRREVIGRPTLLTGLEIDILKRHIIDSLQKQQPQNYQRLVDFIFDQFEKTVSVNSLAHVLKRVGFKTVIGHPMEATRAEVPLKVIQEHYEKMKTLLLNEDVPAAFFFNVDESGFQEFADATDQVFIVPDSYEKNDLVYPVDRDSKRASMIGCIAMDGSALKPFVISYNKSVETQLLAAGYNEENCFIVYQDKGFVNAELFSLWADNVFFPEVKRRRKKYQYRGTVVLTMDGCTAHFSDYFLDECTYNGVYPFQEPAGTSDQVQPLDLGIFGIQKIIKPKERIKIDSCSKNTKTIVQIVNSWRKATTPSNVVAAFQQAGFYLEQDIEDEKQFFVRSDIAFSRAVRGIEHRDNPHVNCCKKFIKLQHELSE